MNDIKLPAEWEKQSGVQLTWPHDLTDWDYILDDAIRCFVNIAKEIVKREKLLIVCPSEKEVKKQLGEIDYSNITFKEIPSNDTWARDHGAISVFANGQPTLLDFTFNGWGMKFAADKDNLISRQLYLDEAFQPDVKYCSQLQFVLEGGSIESDGEGTLLTTEECLLSNNRNDHLSKEEIEKFLKQTFGLKRILWLKNGYLAGDDTDSHIDTLARLCDKETIAYVSCDDPEDEHYEALKAMEAELKEFKTSEGKPYKLIDLPMAPISYEEEDRLPATYANFLIMNDAVLMPTYNDPQKDELAKEQLRKAFPDREIVGIDCRTLIRQHGSLHCVTMQYPLGILK
ncbi:MAG: agmatine deiminase family protein [Paludibacteraceae bacterium]|nr:agmatine deiminase family protein [Paludibacteraceae bacterium]